MRAFGTSSSQGSQLYYMVIHMQTNKELMLTLMANAEAAKYSKFRLLRNWSEYSDVKKLRRAYRLLVASIEESASNVFNKYCKEISAGNSKVINLVAYCELIKVLCFYEKELQTITDMINEYEAYLFEDGNLISAWLFNEPRPADKLYDHRS